MAVPTKFAIHIERLESGAHCVTSPDIPRLLVAKMTLESALSDVHRAISELEEAQWDAASQPTADGSNG